MRNPNLGHLPGLHQKFGRDFALKLFSRASYSHNFEIALAKAHKRGVIPIPIYLSIGTEFNSSALSLALKDVHIFAQHRQHSLYLNFGGDPVLLRDELLGRGNGINGGMAGSNAFGCSQIKMYGQSGMVGEQVPIAVGAAYASREPTLTICGDASFEEDYIYPSLGWAVTHQLPILFICEDNDLSILTQVKDRRTWRASDVARSFGMQAVDIGDDPWVLAHYASEFMRSGRPGFINVRSVRVLWHAGSGQDGPPEWDRYKMVKDELIEMGFTHQELADIELQNQLKAEALWSHL